MAVQGNLDPITLFAPQKIIKDQIQTILDNVDNKPGHIFNLGHGIVPGTPVENVKFAVRTIKELSRKSI